MSDNRPQSINQLIQIRKLLKFAAERGFEKFEDLDLAADRFTTAGILLAAKRLGKTNRVFAMLTDGRDQIQLVLTAGLLGTTPECIASFQRGARVSVTGVPFLSGRNEATARPSLYVVEIHSSSSPAPIKFDEEGLQHEVTPRLVIGHLMALVSEQLEDSGYARYEPRLITSSQVEFETEPLMVRFPGRGVDFFLEVSPLPQLLYAAVMTGEKKLYSPTRLFSRAYRDGFTSADSPIVAAVEVEMGDGSKMALEQITRLLVSGFNKAQDRGLPFDPVPEDEIIVVENEATPPAQDGSIHILIRDLPSQPPPTTNYAYDIRRRISVETPPGQIIIEGHEGKIAQTISYNWLCVHVERLATGDFWRIRQRRGPEPRNQI
jgi:hypothetical protein